MTSGLVAALTMLAIGSAIPAAAAPGTASRFEELRQQDRRVASVTYRLAAANRETCRHTLAPLPGFLLHSLEQYAPASRAGAAASFGLGRDMGVMAVVAGSPAARAGLVADDQLVAVNGIKLGTDEDAAGEGATREFVERAQGIVRDAMTKGAVTLRVSGVGGLRDVRFAAELGCLADVELVPGVDVNAWADGQRVVVTGALVDACRSDDELALVIAHELAHNVLRHRARSAAGAGPNLTLLPDAAAGSTAHRDDEEAADRLAVQMTSAAGYDLSGAPAFLGRLLAAKDPDGLGAGTHPASHRRLALLRAAIAAAGRATSRTAL